MSSRAKKKRMYKEFKIAEEMKGMSNIEMTLFIQESSEIDYLTIRRIAQKYGFLGRLVECTVAGSTIK